MLPVLVVVFLAFDEGWARPLCAAIFIVASVTDWFDGYLARRLGQESKFGAFLDPVADKLMVVTTLVLVTGASQAWWITVPAIIIISREVAISALREWMAELGRRSQVAVSYIGKFKTTAQMIALIFLLYKEDFAGLPIYSIGIISLYVAAFLTIWSMIDYLLAAKKA